MYGCKGNYRRQKVTRQIKEKTKAYKRNGNTIVFYCIDTDDLFINPDRKREFDTIKEYCSQEAAELIWFCRDIEEVFWGERIATSDKVAYASRFKTQSRIAEIDEDKLCSNRVTAKTSCILSVLKKYLDKK